MLTILLHNKVLVNRYDKSFHYMPYSQTLLLSQLIHLSELDFKQK